MRVLATKAHPARLISIAVVMPLAFVMLSACQPGPDADGDGLSDEAESSIGFNPANTDSDGNGIADYVQNTDGDALPDWFELAYSNTDPNLEDSDGDPCGDGWEVLNGLDPTDPADCVVDPCPSPSATSSIGDIQCSALVAIYNATGGESWIDKTGWMTTADPCTWYGVGCTDNIVFDLELGYNELAGAIPPEIRFLTGLIYLELSSNHLTSLPPEIGNLTNLIALTLTDDQLTELPAEISDLASLKALFAQGNQLTALPPEIGNLTGLEVLQLNANQLTALPSVIGNLTNLKNLYLDGNLLTVIPPEVGNFNQLTDLTINNNRLTGDITDWALPLSTANKINYLKVGDGHGANNCLYVTDTSTAKWLTGKNSSWNECDE